MRCSVWGSPPEELDQLDDVRQAQVELWAHGVVVDHDPIVRFFAAWQSWGRMLLGSEDA